MGPLPKRRPVPRHLVGPRDPDAVDYALLALLLLPTGLLTLSGIRKATQRRRRNRDESQYDEDDEPTPVGACRNTLWLVGCVSGWG